MISQVSSPIRVFLRTGRCQIRASDGRAFNFKLNRDPMTHCPYITAHQQKAEIGHFDLWQQRGWLFVIHGTYATSKYHESYVEWSSSCLLEPAIEVEQPWRSRYRGIGSSLVSLALYWGQNQGLPGMRIHQPQTPDFWLKLNFVWRKEGDYLDLFFEYNVQRIPEPVIQLKGISHEPN